MIYICIPTHNEQQTVGVVLWKLREVLTGFPRDYELLVADDASTDKTRDVLEPYTRVLPLTVIHSERRLGQAASLEMLLREAVRRSEYPKRDLIVTLEADFSDEPEDIVPLIKRIEAGADVAVGNKVGGMRETRSRRWSRKLAGFFARGPKWPKEIDTPFDGYRAYRLYSVKKAIEARQGRLVRHEAWAGHAELLQHVLPHARRVDAVTVVDRTDRLQRERRERPLASAMSVRAMRRGADPADLVTVEELDRIAATASRSRDGKLLLEEAAQQARSAESRSNGGSRARSGRSRNGGSQSERSGPKRERTRASQGGRDATERKRPPRKPRQSSQADDAKADTTAPAAESPATESPAAAAAAPDTNRNDTPGADAPPKKKRRRRRRRRSGSGSGGAAQSEGQTSGESQSTDESAPQGDSRPQGGAQPQADDAPGAGGPTSDSGTEGDEPGTPPRKRRRRGGRRGGRGRRRRPQGATGEDGQTAAGDASSGPDGETRAQTGENGPEAAGGKPSD